jgi:hypothetical protein
MMKGAVRWHVNVMATRRMRGKWLVISIKHTSKGYKTWRWLEVEVDVFANDADVKNK